MPPKPARQPLEIDPAALDEARRDQQKKDTREAAIRARQAAGLTRKQAEEAQTSQDLQDGNA